MQFIPISNSVPIPNHIPGSPNLTCGGPWLWRADSSAVMLRAGLADLNQCDLNQLIFSSKKSSDLNRTDDFTYQ